MLTGKAFGQARGADLAADLDALQAQLCVEWGFCSLVRGHDLVARFPLMTGELFARAVIEGEGMVPDQEKVWVRRLSTRFTERYGAEISEDRYPQRR